MIKEISKDVWDDEVGNKINSIFFNGNFIEQIKKSFELDLNYFYCVDEEDVLFAAAVFSKGRAIVTPLAFTYCPIFFNDNLSDSKYLKLAKDFLELLKLKWSKIQLRLGPDINDLRPFIWEGFKVNLRYTYVKSTNTPFHINIYKTLTNNKIKNFNFVVEEADNKSITENLVESLKFGITEKQFGHHYSFFKSLSPENLKVCKIYIGGELICSELILIDPPSATVYALLILSSKNSLVHRYMHQQAIKWCENNNLNFYDFCGANDEGTAQFKSYFNANLRAYHLIFYSRKRNFFLKNKMKLVGFVKRKLRYLNGSF